MYCKHCGNEIAPSVSFCGFCGTKVEKFQKQQKTNIMSIIGVILAGISLLLNFWGIVGICAVVFSTVGLLQVNSSEEKGKEISVAGIIVGGFSVLYGFFSLFMLI